MYLSFVQLFTLCFDEKDLVERDGKIERKNVPEFCTAVYSMY